MLEMYVRTQDGKGYVNCENVMQIFVMEADGFTVSFGVDDAILFLGTYKTEERAVEVMTDLVEFIECMESSHYTESTYSNKDVKRGGIYLMPKE